MSLIAEGTGKVSISLAVVEMGKEVATTCSSLSQQSVPLSSSVNTQKSDLSSQDLQNYI